MKITHKKLDLERDHVEEDIASSLYALASNGFKVGVDAPTLIAMALDPALSSALDAVIRIVTLGDMRVAENMVAHRLGGSIVTQSVVIRSVSSEGCIHFVEATATINLNDSLDRQKVVATAIVETLKVLLLGEYDLVRHKPAVASILAGIEAP